MELIKTKDALEILEEKGNPIVKATLINWIKKYHLGIKIGGQWRIDKEKFENFIENGGDDDGTSCSPESSESNSTTN